MSEQKPKTVVPDNLLDQLRGLDASRLYTVKELSERFNLTTSNLNSYLYSLMWKNLVKKEDPEEGKKAPRWRIQIAEAERVQDVVLSYLEDNPEGVNPQTLAKLCNIPKSDLNKYLYRWEKDQLVRKTADPDGKNPKWFLTE